ncbi:MAG: LacI family DNA-binding transcriptional regulator [Lachnospiraceae bacterium]|nr:LacI family DNA-binding transcriptional regulator [Lachnospiraceae bacterium]
MKPEKERVRIVDIAEELGLSTATVSNVIHGKTKKISDKTVQRVQQLLEERQYIPSMAGILLAQNDSKIICVVINDHEKYEKRVLQDAFVVGSIDYLAEAIEETGFFMMIKKTNNIQDIIRYASMWNMAGLVLIGFCERDYEKLREKMHIPFVVYDGFVEKIDRYANISIDHFAGGYQMGKYLLQMGHEKILFAADNDESMDHERYLGLQQAIKEHIGNSGMDATEAKLLLLPLQKEERMLFYRKNMELIKRHTVLFCASDVYAIEVMNYLSDSGMKVPEDISIAGFDDIPESTIVRPRLTTVRQDMEQRARMTKEILRAWRDGTSFEQNILLPVTVVERDSVKSIQKHS